MPVETKSRNRIQIDERGRTMYFIDGKLSNKETYEKTMGPIPKAPKEVKENIITNCPFCGKPGVRMKFVNLQKVKLCEEDYQTKTTGEVAEALRK